MKNSRSVHVDFGQYQIDVNQNEQKIKSEREFCYTQILVFGYTFIEPYIISNASLIVVGSRKGQLSSTCGLWVNNS